MITIHPANAEDFSGLGLGALTPTECVIEEVAGGMFELTMTHPMDDSMRWLNIDFGRVICAPAPVRETPLINMSAGLQVRQIYRVTASKLNMRTKGSTSTGKVIRSYKRGTQVIKLDETSSWMRVVIKNGGATGWMHKNYLAYVGTQTETVVGDRPGGVVEPRQTREQLFRITSVERDDTKKVVNVVAQHIFYDLKGNLVKDVYAPKNVAANVAANTAWSKLLNDHEFTLYTTATGPVTGEYTRLSIIEALLDPDQGIVPQAGARLVRDNFDVFVLADEVRDFGVEIRHGKNLTGAMLSVDMTDVVTRIIPVGKTKKGDPLLLSGTQYVDSPRIAEYPVIYAKQIEYDVQVGQDGIGSDAAARTKLRQLAEADFAAGIDSPTVGLDVDFVALEQTEEYAAYAGLQYIHLYDTVRVIDRGAGIDAKVRMTGYTFDAIRQRYISVTLGELQEMETTVYGYSIAEGSTRGTKLAGNSVPGTKLRDLDVHEAKIAEAAITEAKIADAAITSAKIADATIDTAHIKDGVIDKAHLKEATVNDLKADAIDAVRGKFEQIAAGEMTADEMYAAFAEILLLRIRKATAGEVETDYLKAELANLIKAQIGVAEIGYAKIVDTVTGSIIFSDGVGGKLYIARLAVDEANLVSLTAGEILLRGEGGKMYALIVDEEGQITTVEKTIGDDDIDPNSLSGDRIIEKSITAREINVTSLMGDSAMIRAIKAANIDVADLFAAEAFIAKLNAADISANKSLEIYVKEADQRLYLRFNKDTDTITLGRDDSDVLLELLPGEDAGLYIKQNGLTLAQFARTLATVKRLEITDAILFPNHVMKAMGNGDLAILAR